MKKIKKLSVIMILFAVVFLFACESNEEKNKETESTNGNYVNTTNTDSSVDTSNAETVIKFGMVSSETHSSYKAADLFKQEVEEQSEGRIKVELYPNSVLGGDAQLTQAVSLGTVQMALPATTIFTTYNPQWGVLDLPFMFKNADEAFKVVDSSIGEELNKSLDEVNIINLGFGFNGIRNMTNNVKTINTPDDLKGIKMRVMESPVFIDMFTYLGANATPMSFSELFTGLQQKTVDGQENPASLIYESKFNEVQKYFSETKHVYNFLAYIVNKPFYEGLSDEDKKIVSDATQKYLVDWQRKTEIEEDQGYIKKLEESGMEINKVSDENLKLFKEKLEPMYEKYKGEFGEEIFNEINEVIKE